MKPKIILLILATLLISFGYFAKNFELDASSDTLLLENDPDLKYLREVNKKYGSEDYLVLTYTPKKKLLDPETITNLTNLKNDYWFSDLILMFQKEVADRIIAQYNTSAYGRLSILANWRLNINKICDISPESFSPRPKIDSSLLVFTPKSKIFELSEVLATVIVVARRTLKVKPKIATCRVMNAPSKSLGIASKV